MDLSWRSASVRRAEDAFKGRDTTAGLACCRRAAGMALNAVLIVEPREGWGRSYVDHVRALGREDAVPAAVRSACKVLLDRAAAEPSLPDAPLARRGGLRLVEAARDVMAHAYAVVMRNHAE